MQSNTKFEIDTNKQKVRQLEQSKAMLEAQELIMKENLKFTQNSKDKEIEKYQSELSALKEELRS